MLVLTRLQRGDYPRMVPVTAAQTDGHLLFTDKAGVDAFIEAYRRADPAASFDMHVVPEVSPRAFWQNCRDHDWHYENSDDHGTWRKGGHSAWELQVQSMISMPHRRIYLGWQKHKSTGPIYGTEQHPAPEQPDFDVEPEA